MAFTRRDVIISAFFPTISDASQITPAEFTGWCSKLDAIMAAHAAGSVNYAQTIVSTPTEAYLNEELSIPHVLFDALSNILRAEINDSLGKLTAAQDNARNAGILQLRSWGAPPVPRYVPYGLPHFRGGLSPRRENTVEDSFYNPIGIPNPLP